MPVMAKSRASDRVSPQVKRKKKKEEFRLGLNAFGFICAGVSNVSGCERNA